MYKGESFRFASRFATYLPAGDTKDGLSTGQTSIDWNNHFESTMGRVTPFGEIGIANTVTDTNKYNRPYAVYGNNVHVTGGAMFDVTEKVSIGGSGYDIFPWGAQTLYSRVVPRNSSNLMGNSSKSRAFEQNSFTTGTSALGKDDGVSAWVDYMPAPYVTAELGYTRSIEFALNTLSFGVRFDLAHLARKSARK